MGSTNLQRGFTLTEVMIASAILAFAVIAITQLIVAGQTQSIEALHHRRGQSLAEALMDEILALPYTDPQGDTTIGPDAGERNRNEFDNIDDYHGFNEEAGAICDAHGQPYGGQFDRFRRTVTVEPYMQPLTGSAPIAGLRIIVTVTDERGLSWTITRFVPEPTI